MKKLLHAYLVLLFSILLFSSCSLHDGRSISADASQKPKITFKRQPTRINKNNEKFIIQPIVEVHDSRGIALERYKGTKIIIDLMNGSDDFYAEDATLHMGNKTCDDDEPCVFTLDNKGRFDFGKSEGRRKKNELKVNCPSCSGLKSYRLVLSPEREDVDLDQVKSDQFWLQNK